MSLPFPSPETLASAAAALRRGENVVVPTETVYGLAGFALDERAVARIFEIKGRPRFNPLIVHVGSDTQLEQIVSSVSDGARALMDRFWPGPLTLVLPRHAALPEIVTAGLPTVAVRRPDHPVALALLQQADLPFAAPSANRFGHVSPTSRAHIAPEIERQVAAVLDGGECRIGVESTIIAEIEGQWRCLRPGGLALEEIEAVVGPVPIHHSNVPLAPGMLSRHYAPHTRCAYDATGTLRPPAGKKAALVTLTAPDDAEHFAHVEVLSRRGDLREAAARLFGVLRHLDTLSVDIAILRAVPETGLGRAINDRLKRAAA